MNRPLLLTGLLLTTASAIITACNKKPAEEATTNSYNTTAPFALATRPLPDPIAILTDTSAATQPEDGRSQPAGDVKKVTLADGLIVEDLRIGKGPAVGEYSRVFVVYTGWLDDPKIIFDDSRSLVPRGFYLGKGEVIKGWDKGLLGMRPGGIRLLTIPAPLGYGDKPKDKIPANATLHFRIFLDHIEQ